MYFVFGPDEFIVEMAVRTLLVCFGVLTLLTTALTPAVADEVFSLGMELAVVVAGILEVDVVVES